MPRKKNTQEMIFGAFGVGDIASDCGWFWLALEHLGALVGCFEVFCNLGHIKVKLH